MTLSIDLLKEKFNRYNALIFAGRLPDVPILICEAKTFAGQCRSKVRRLPDGRREHYDFTIKISNKFSQTEEELDDTLIHEMIHYFIALHGFEDTSTHGQLFKAMIHSINASHGRNITISGRYDRDTMQATKGRWHVVALIQMKNGQTGIKVLPRVQPKIITFYKNVKASRQVKSVDLYLHCDPYFDTFPTSTALRVHYVEPELLQSKLQGAHRLEVSGNTLIQR